MDPAAWDVLAQDGPQAAAAAEAAAPAEAAPVAAPPAVQQAEIPPPTPAPTPLPVPPRPPAPVSPAVAQAHPPPMHPQRVAARPAAGHGSGNPGTALGHAAEGQNAGIATSGASGANNGAAWMGKLKQWWDQHSYYPKEASQTNDGGTVRVRIVITADGQVTSIDVVQGSGSGVLDAAAIAVFRNAHLPPFPPGAPAQPADVVVTLHYHPADNAG